MLTHAGSLLRGTARFFHRYMKKVTQIKRRKHGERRKWRESSRRAPRVPFSPFVIPDFLLDDLGTSLIQSIWHDKLESHCIRYIGESDVTWSPDDLHPLDGRVLSVLQDGPEYTDVDLDPFRSASWRHEALMAMFRVAQASTGNTFRLSDVPEDEVANWLTASGNERNHPEIDRIMGTDLLHDFNHAQALHNGRCPEDRFTRTALHVTSLAAIPSILSKGLVPQIGALSRLIETQEAIYLFARWSDMESADWLYDNWPRRSEPALLAVNMRGLNVDADASYELVSYNRIEPWRISVLAAGENDWDNQKATFLGMGGKA